MIHPLVKESKPIHPLLKDHNLEPSFVYPYFWYWMTERHSIFQKRLLGLDPPYSEDPVFVSGKFTNVYRVLDRVSQFVVRTIQSSGYGCDPIYMPRDAAFRTIFFKMFNRHTWWDEFVAKVGDPTIGNFDRDVYIRALDDLKHEGHKLYSGAYMMSGALGDSGSRTKHHNHLYMIADLVEDGFFDTVIEQKTYADLYKLILDMRYAGSFLAMQFAADLNYMDHFHFDDNDFIIAGPGAWRGTLKLFKEMPEDMDANKIIALLHFIKEDELAGYDFTGIPGHMPTYMDIQNCLCEVDKYSRTIDGVDNLGRSRIKGRFYENKEPIHYTLPRWWCVNPKNMKLHASAAETGRIQTVLPNTGVNSVTE